MQAGVNLKKCVGFYFPKDKNNLTKEDYLKKIKLSVGKQTYNQDIEKVFLNIYDLKEEYYNDWIEYLKKVSYNQLYNYAPYILPQLEKPKYSEKFKALIIIEMEIFKGKCIYLATKDIRDYINDSSKLGLLVVEKENIKNGNSICVKKAQDLFENAFSDFESPAITTNYKRIYDSIPNEMYEYIDRILGYKAFRDDRNKEFAFKQHYDERDKKLGRKLYR